MNPALRIGAVGFGLIAVCYGFARFAFGLFLPQIDSDLSLGPSLSGLISGGAFAGYCVAIIASAALTERIGARAIATAAAIIAAVGMAGIALAPSPMVLAAAVMVADDGRGSDCRRASFRYPDGGSWRRAGSDVLCRTCPTGWVLPG